MPTVKARQNRADFERAWPRNWEKVRLLKLFSHWNGLSVGATRTGDCRCRRCRPMREMALNRSAGRQSEQYGQTRDAGVQVGTERLAEAVQCTAALRCSDQTSGARSFAAHLFPLLYPAWEH